MAWSEAHRIASFVTLTGGGVPTQEFDESLDSSRDRSRLLGSILWLQLGIHVAYFTRPGALRILETLSPAFDGVYDWLQVYGRSLPPGLLDDVLRIRTEGFTEKPLPGTPPADVAGLHFRQALTVVGSYLSLDQGLWSPLAGAIMFASDEMWQSTLDTLNEDQVPDGESPRPFIDDAAGLLRCMDAALTVANASARDERLDALQQEQLSSELLTRFSWPLHLGPEMQLRRFNAFYSTLTDRVVGDLDASLLALPIQSDIARLRDAWEGIAQSRAEAIVHS